MQSRTDITTTLILAGLLAGCASTYQPGLEHKPQMSLEEAKTIVRTRAGSHHHAVGYGAVEKIEISWSSVHIIRSDKGQVICSLDQVTSTVSGKAGWYHVELIGCPDEGREFVRVATFDSDSSSASRLADAIYVIKQNNLARRGPPETPQQQAAFDTVVKQYRATQPPPALPEAAARYKAQAEFAVQQKRFDDAVDLYGKALEVAPWWAAGRYNRGLLLGELEAYNEGIRELQKYLKLEPESPNAKAVQTKIYQWESLAPQGASSTPAAAGSTSKEVQPCRTAFGCVSQ